MAARSWILWPSLLGLVALLCWAGAAQARPAQLPPNTLVKWEQSKPGRSTTYRAEGLTIRLGGRAIDRGRGDGRVPVITVTSPDGQTITLSGERGLSTARARVGVGYLDRSSRYPQVVFSSFNGGAYCCDRIWVLDYRGGRWRALHVGEQHDGVVNRFPRDEDGDGAREFVLHDYRLVGSFCAQVCTWRPLTVIAVRNGRLVDVTTARRYRPLHRRDMEQARVYCQDSGGVNGLCAGFVASAARAGRFEEGWAFMLKQITPRAREAGEINVHPCRVPVRRGRCPAGQQVTFRDFPTALRWTLGDLGYLPPVPLPPRT